MSIPPLVCNTPPPPDQCEEEKEDFDLHYSLSQDDEDDGDFHFQGFSTYNEYHSNSNYNEGHKDISQPIPNDEVFNKLEQKENNTEISFEDRTHENKPKTFITEEIIVEDLNLSVQKETITADIADNAKVIEEVIQNNEENEDIDTTNDISTKDLNTTKIEINILEESNSSIFTDQSELEPYITDKGNKNKTSDSSFNEDCNFKELDTDITSSETQTKENLDIPITSQINDESDHEFDEFRDSNDIQPDHIGNIESNNESDFDDFKDFKDSNDSTTATIFEDPWGPTEAEEAEFSDFKANFDSINSPNNDEDFDEFKSSNIVENPNETKNITEKPTDQFSFNSPIQIENVTKVLNSIFESEAPIEEIEETNLDMSLGETWRQLLDTDERQPYMVAWNDSCGQKTLLKALCIDSRNILFAPKWNCNTPKFAANLSNAPLQPQKPPSTSEVSEKQSNKSSTSWTDNITADGKEFTYAEALLLDLENLMATLDQMASNHSTLNISDLLSHACKTDKERTVTESRPEIELFAPVPNKSEQIFSSTINIQPIRQINLPDTHIFTPTDSETPRSKTIHYSSGPILHSQSSSEPNSISVGIENTTQDSKDEYWEFQDFKGASEANETLQSHTVVGAKQMSLPTDTTMATQILQPVKVDMLMPTLNWPNPGEIKETFDDFADFMSKTSNVEDQIETTFPVFSTKNVADNTPIVETRTEISNHLSNTNNLPAGDSFDDFDTFQSAVPPSQSIPDSSAAMNTMPQVTSNVDYGFFNRSDKTSSENISNESTRPNNALKSNQSFLEKSLPMQITEIPMIPSSILQPTVNNSNTSNSKTGQILQPLSLESYSQINWPNPGIDLQDLSRFNPVDTLQSLKSDLSTGTQSKGASPVHNNKPVQNQPEDDVWGEFVSSKPKPTFPTPVADDDEWSDFISSPNMKTQNGLNTISFNVHTNTNLQKPSNKLSKNNDSFDIPTLNYITPKSGSSKSYNIDRHLQRL